MRAPLTVRRKPDRQAAIIPPGACSSRRSAPVRQVSCHRAVTSAVPSSPASFSASAVKVRAPSSMPASSAAGDSRVSVAMLLFLPAWPGRGYSPGQRFFAPGPAATERVHSLASSERRPPTVPPGTERCQEAAHGERPADADRRALGSGGRDQVAGANGEMVLVLGGGGGGT